MQRGCVQTGGIPFWRTLLAVTGVAVYTHSPLVRDDAQLCYAVAKRLWAA